MKRLIFLHTVDPNPKDEKLKPVLLAKLEEKSRLKAINDFREQLKQFPSITIIQLSDTKPQVIIDLPDQEWSDIYPKLCKIKEIHLIDSVVPEQIN
jgi:hypothetical protein